jgi:hypothetical protein
VSQPFSGLNEQGRQVIEISTADVAQLNALEIIPDAFIWVEIGYRRGEVCFNTR